MFFKKRKLKKKKYKKIKNNFYNTGFKTSFSFFDIIKYKIRLADYDDHLGVRYSYLFSFKLFNWEVCRMKYTDQKGKVFKRKIKFGSI